MWIDSTGHQKHFYTSCRIRNIDFVAIEIIAGDCVKWNIVNCHISASFCRELVLVYIAGGKQLYEIMHILPLQ
jgi:hypothetical protein